MLPEQVYNQIELMPSGKIVNGSIETSARPLWVSGMWFYQFVLSAEAVYCLLFMP